MRGREPYQFRREDAERFAIEKGFKGRIVGKEYVLDRCPYCGEKTGNMGRRKFSINLMTGQFNCFRASCGAKGNMITLAKDFDFSLGTEIDTYYHLGEQRHYRVFKKPEPIEPEDAAIEYLGGRGISKDVVRKFQITIDGKGNIVFPFLDENGDLQFIKYRNPNPKPGQGKEWAEANTKPILFGMKQCDLTNHTLILTEGQIDSLSVAEAGFDNVVSVPTGANGFTWVPHCWNWMQNFDKIIVFGDHENDHITLYNEMVDRFGYKVWHVRETDYLDCKDANDILRKYGIEQIKKCIQNAENTPISKTIKLSQVERVNISAIEKLPTGIREVDKLLCGGLPFGQLIILTGKAGDGKSTLASQILLNAAEKNYKCFAYSGELPNYLFRSWFDLQAAGINHTYKEWSQWREFETYEVKSEARQKISDWYDDKIWLYDNSMVEGEDTSLSTMLEQLIIRYGIRVVLIDNLMTALDLEQGLGPDKYERQSLFVKRLSRLALKFNILIMLVAHKRKDTGFNEVNDSVSGSADIINLGSIVMSYERPTAKRINDIGDATEYDRILKVTKNRLFGRIDTHGFVMHYSNQCKRIYIDDAELQRSYSWEEDVEPEVVIEPPPF